MYEEILNALKTKFKGVPSKVLEQRARNISKTVTEEDGVQTAVDGITLDDLFKAHGDSRATEASKTAGEKAVKKFREEKKLDDDGKPISSGGGDDDDDDDDPPADGDKAPKWAKGLVKKVDDLSTELAGYKQKEAATERQLQLPGNLKLPEFLRSYINAFLLLMTRTMMLLTQLLPSISRSLTI